MTHFNNRCDPTLAAHSAMRVGIPPHDSAKEIYVEVSCDLKAIWRLLRGQLSDRIELPGRHSRGSSDKEDERRSAADAV